MLTTARVRELKPRDKMYEVTCAAMPGFVVRVLPTGKKVFLVRHQVGDTLKREKIWLMGRTSASKTRRQAVLILGGYARDEAANEPVARRSAREEAAPKPVARRSAPKPTRQVELLKQPEPSRPTVCELADRFVHSLRSPYDQLYSPLSKPVPRLRTARTLVAAVLRLSVKVHMAGPGVSCRNFWQGSSMRPHSPGHAVDPRRVVVVQRLRGMNTARRRCAASVVQIHGDVGRLGEEPAGDRAGRAGRRWVREVER